MSATHIQLVRTLRTANQQGELQMNQVLALIAYMTARVNVARDEAKDRGATATEYALLVTFIAIAIVVAVTAFGSALSKFFGDIGKTIGGWKTS